MKQQTIKDKIEVSGVGIHSGKPSNMVLEPMEANSGIIFYRSDKNKTLRVNFDSVKETVLNTTVEEDGVKISTVEHLLSAIYAYGIDNIRIVIDNEEVPVLDGSSSAYCMLIDEVGLVEQDAPKRFIKIKRSVKVKEDWKYASLSPSSGKDTSFDFTIDFTHPLIRKQSFAFKLSPQKYKKEISRARTFGFIEEVQYLRSRNLALGGSLDNTVVLDKSKILNPEGLRYKDEFVRHKMLDAIGDMSFLGLMLLGKYKSLGGSHKINNMLVREVLKDKANYEIVEFVGAKEREVSKEHAYAFNESD